ncbi:MAG: response regulator transcription factor [Bdellovibrionota bacterium]
MSRILCIEDNKEFQIYLSSILKDYSLTYAPTIGEALRLVSNGRDSFDLILLDVNLPDGNGVKALPQLKEHNQNKMIPIIILSSDNDVLTKVAAFGLGADDYVSKPLDPNELKARIEARMRWFKSQVHEKTVVEFGDIKIDTERMVVEKIEDNGTRRNIDLTPFEFKILRLLVNRPGQVFSRDQIIERVWGLGRHVTSRTVDAHVSHLRKKMDARQVEIETVLSAGYKIGLKDVR